MPSMKIIKRRIGSVRSIRQITKAMDLVATSKLGKAKARLASTRPLFGEATRIIETVKNCEGVSENAFALGREVQSSAYIVITSDRGLCGGYNTLISREALSSMSGKNEKVITIGTKGRDYLRRRGKNIVQKYNGVTESSLYAEAEQIAGTIVSAYLSGEFDEVYVAYTHFESTLTHQPRVARILPIEISTENPGTGNGMEYEPDPNTFLEHAVPMYLSMFIYGAMAESVACEMAARMTSMDAATGNADDIIEKLTLQYNRTRQGVITQEINEIVGGASALQ
ncbi:MAG: ATP synthase F1 subunit gamma [Oscillospiraceae bacterium]|nr:ATP synthase F1 subunit gamma [Oscillospiraceae bacterium]